VAEEKALLEAKVQELQMEWSPGGRKGTSSDSSDPMINGDIYGYLLTH
jgi:hypothetical protein